MIQITPIQMNFCHSKSINLSRRIIRISCISINIDNYRINDPIRHHNIFYNCYVSNVKKKIPPKAKLEEK